MQHPIPIPSGMLPRIRYFWISFPLMAVSVLAFASASASAPATQETGAADILIADAGGKEGKGNKSVGVEGKNPGKSSGAAKVEKVGQPGRAEKPGYPKQQNQVWNTPEEIRAWQKQRGWHNAGAWPGNAKWKGARAKDWKTERRTWPERGGYRGRMIGHTDFQKHFGEARPFRMWWQPKVKDGYPQFSHAGNTFRIVDPYPENWSPSWFRGTPVHVTYDNGYYLHNRKHPGFPIAVMVVQ